jgi:hypothetical protein
MKKDKKIKGEKSNKLLPSYYYMEGERIIFTEEFHLKRGQCCGNGCRHCAYEPKHQKGNTTIKK